MSSELCRGWAKKLAAPFTKQPQKTERKSLKRAAFLFNGHLCWPKLTFPPASKEIMAYVNIPLSEAKRLGVVWAADKRLLGKWVKRWLVYESLCTSRCRMQQGNNWLAIKKKQPSIFEMEQCPKERGQINQAKDKNLLQNYGENKWGGGEIKVKINMFLSLATLNGLLLIRIEWKDFKDLFID